MDEIHQPLPEVRKPLIQRTLTEWRTLATLGGPILIAQVAQMANGVIDTVMAGHASAEDLAAVGIGSIKTHNAGDVIRAGASGGAVVSGICSADDPEEAARQLRHAVEEARNLAG